jgi:hypothetical protein
MKWLNHQTDLLEILRFRLSYEMVKIIRQPYLENSYEMVKIIRQLYLNYKKNEMVKSQTAFLEL